ncbi:GntR family transcriptional regulator [Arthrobacter sp. NPDC058097]|uniref:GntR family transcriptional regulator n=1 Tax=Arthrobacter sp. NPDC058097 TaxID=3346340 RepID=UPI0036DEF172
MSTLAVPTAPRPAAGRQQLPDEVAGYVREQIMSGNLRPGQFLRMEPIAEAIGVSITPVREGLLALSSQGFVTAVPRRGFMVTPFTRQDVHDLFWAQGKLAGELAARAAKQITEEELALLAEVQAQCDVAIERGEIGEIGRLGHEFHRIINHAAHSDRLARLLGGVVKHLPNHFYASLESHVATSTPAHAQIFEAVSRHDAKQASRLTEKHLAESAEIVIRMLEERGIWKDADGGQ